MTTSKRHKQSLCPMNGLCFFVSLNTWLLLL